MCHTKSATGPHEQTRARTRGFVLALVCFRGHVALLVWHIGVPRCYCSDLTGAIFLRRNSGLMKLLFPKARATFDAYMCIYGITLLQRVKMPKTL